MVTNQRKETARHENFFALSLLETVMGSRKVAARGELFDCHEIIINYHGEKLSWSKQLLERLNQLPRQII